jgi:hypothetical protein
VSSIVQNVPLVPPPAPPPRRSPLVPIGVGLVLAGVVLPRPLQKIAEGLTEPLVRAVLFLGTDVFRLCFFVGVVLITIGSLRSRRTPPGPPR